MVKKFLTYVRNNFRQIIKAIYCILIGSLVFFVFGMWISYQIQENSYGRFNGFQPISNALGYPMYLTTFCYLLGGCLGFFGIAMLGQPDPDELSKIIGWTVIVWNICQEIDQIIRNPYPDSHIMDIIVGTLAVKIFWLYVKRFFPKQSP